MIPIHNYLTSTFLSRPIKPPSPMTANVEVSFASNGQQNSSGIASQPIASLYNPSSNPSHLQKPSSHAIHKAMIEKTIAEDLYTKVVEEKERLRITASNTLKLLKSKLIASQEQVRISSKKLNDIEKEKSNRYKSYKAFKDAYEQCQQFHEYIKDFDENENDNTENSFGMSSEKISEKFHSSTTAMINDKSMSSFPWKEFETYMNSEDRFYSSYTLASSPSKSDLSRMRSSSLGNNVDIILSTPISSLLTSSVSSPSPISYADQQKLYFEDRIKVLSEENKTLKQEVKEYKSELESYIRDDVIKPRNILYSIENEVVQVDRPMFDIVNIVEQAPVDTRTMIDKRNILDMTVMCINDDDSEYEETLSLNDSTISSPRERVIGSPREKVMTRENSEMRDYKERDTIDNRLRRIYDTLQDNLIQIRQNNIKGTEYKEIHLKLISRQLSQRLDKLQQQISQQQISFLSPLQKQQTSAVSWPVGSSFASSKASATSYESYELKKLQKVNKQLQDQVNTKDKENRDLKHSMVQNQTHVLVQQHQYAMKMNDKKDIFDILEKSIKNSNH